MTSTPKKEHEQRKFGEEETGCASEPNSVKAASKGVSKLARRARSFKEDLIERLAYMRSSGGGSGSGSGVGGNFTNGKQQHPGRNSTNSRKNGGGGGGWRRSKSPGKFSSDTEVMFDSPADPAKDLDFYMKQVRLSLRHFKDVISKNRLEVLPGNGTVVLEVISNMYSLLKSYSLNERSCSIVSGLNQVYQSVAKLIRLCDDIVISGKCDLDSEYLSETIHLVEEAVQNLVTVVGEKLSEKERDSSRLYECSDGSRGFTASSGGGGSGGGTDAVQYRVSLPEISMSPKERRLLEQSTQCVLRKHSPSKYGQEDFPPPCKPPLPFHRYYENSPPPLPPKKRNNYGNSLAPNSTSLERLSLKSDGSSITSIDSSSGESSSMRLTRGRISSTASCGYSASASSSSRNSSHRFSEQSQQTFFSASSSVDGLQMVTTTQHGASRVSVSSCKYASLSSSARSDDETPPALPVKTRKFKWETPPRLHLELCGDANRVQLFCQGIRSNGLDSEDSDSPPPLPMKKKHIMAYMEMFGNCSHGNSQEFLRHSVHTYSMLQAEWQKHELNLATTTQSCSFNVYNYVHSSPDSSPPPELPPRRGKMESEAPSHSSFLLKAPLVAAPPEESSITIEEVREEEAANQAVKATSPAISPAEGEGLDEENGPLAEMDVSEWIVFKKEDEEGPDVRGGHPDALIVMATKANRDDFLFQEAFLTTYRTFVSPMALVEKLIARYHRFNAPSDAIRQRAARETFSLMVRVVSDVTVSDLEEQMVSVLLEFVYQLLCNGDLIMGKTLRVKLMERYCAKAAKNVGKTSLCAQNVYTRQSNLLDFKPEQLAEQMTLLDAELFRNIEIPEVLTWVQEQNEEKSPNLTCFTEHFNKMSYWARTKILEQSDAKERERYVLKFIKVMKHLRKINNFNSYLALLSALDSAPVRRLEWQRQITEGLKEYCALIDSSSSFKVYRQALAEAQPPCIPYIGLVLQDLTFVHIGNSDQLSEGVINFGKRWQQFNIVENMKRFKKILYNYKSNERIVAFFNNFDDFICEESMWQISETIKPRGGKKTK